MDSETAKIENSIKLALKAAETANDSAEDVARLNHATEKAAEKLDKFGKLMRPAIVGAMSGALLSIVIAGVVYVRAVSEMRTVSAANVEALAVFTATVTDLKSQVETIAALNEPMQVMTESQQEQFLAITELLNRRADAIEAAMTQPAAAGSEAADTGSVPQMLRSVIEAVEASHMETQQTVISNISDLQLAMTRLVGDELSALQSAKPAAPTSTPPATKPAPKPAAAPRPAAPTPDPFKYP